MRPFDFSFYPRKVPDVSCLKTSRSPRDGIISFLHVSYPYLSIWNVWRMPLRSIYPEVWFSERQCTPASFSYLATKREILSFASCCFCSAALRLSQIYLYHCSNFLGVMLPIRFGAFSEDVSKKSEYTTASKSPRQILPFCSSRNESNKSL